MMKKIRHWALLAAIVACFGASSTTQASTAQQLSPVYIDPDHGFIYFLVANNGFKTIKNLFGTVYGYGSPVRRGTWQVNNPHSEGLKVSLGDHRPGSAALYRFMVTRDNMDFTGYRLTIKEESLFFKSKLRQ